MLPCCQVYTGGLVFRISLEGWTLPPALGYVVKPDDQEKSSDPVRCADMGRDTRFVAVSAQPILAGDEREWLGDQAVCSHLDQYHIAHAGVMRAKPPFEILRNYLTGTFMLACYEGEGEVLADNRWLRIRAGQACLQPPFVHNGLKCLPRNLENLLGSVIYFPFQTRKWSRLLML